MNKYSEYIDFKAVSTEQLTNGYYYEQYKKEGWELIEIFQKSERHVHNDIDSMGCSRENYYVMIESYALLGKTRETELLYG